MPKAPKNKHKKTKVHRCFVVDCPYKNEKGLSYHQVPKNVTSEVKQKWIEVVPEVIDDNASNPVRICSKHFLPTDFERNLRNELLGLQMRRVLRPGAYPRTQKELNLNEQKAQEDLSIAGYNLKNSQSKTVQNDPNGPLKLSDNTISHSVKETEKKNENTNEVLNKVAREVEILAEIAELQSKLLEKLGKKANLESFASVLSDPISNQFKISQERIVKSIKNEVYKKKPTFMEEPSPAILAVEDAKTMTSKKHENFKTELLNILNLKDQEGPLAVFDLQGYSHWKPSIQSALEEKTKLQKIEPQMKLMLKNKSERTRKKMIDEGHKILQKRREEIEQYKLKIGKN